MGEFVYNIKAKDGTILMTTDDYTAEIAYRLGARITCKRVKLE